MLLKLLNLIEADDLGPALERLSFYRSQHRRIDDGRLCASVFRHNNIVYSGCATVSPPNNPGVVGKEWCYVNEQLIGQAGKLDWGYCIPPTQYEELRMDAMNARETAQKKKEREQENAAKEENAKTEALQALKSVCTVDLPVVLQDVTQLVESADKLKKLQSSALTASTELGKLKAEIDKLKNDKKIKDKLETYGAHMFVFDNSNLRGKPKFDTVIDTVDKIYESTGEIFKGVSGENYSVRIQGYILPFTTGDYIFALKTTLGGTLFVNKELLVNYNISYPAFNPPDFPNERLWPTEITEKPVFESEPVSLEENKPVSFVVDMIFTNDLLYEVGATAELKLMWKTPGAKDFKVVPNFNLLQHIDVQAIRIDAIKGPSAASWVSDELIPGTLAFSNNQDDYIGDVSSEFIGLKSLKSKKEGNTDLIVQFSKPSSLIVFKPSNTQILSAYCERTKLETAPIDAHITIYHTENGSKRALSQKTYEAVEIITNGCQNDMKISFAGGPAVLAYYTGHRSGGCTGGALRNLTAPGSQYLDHCVDSDDRSCEVALNGNPKNASELSVRDQNKSYYRIRRNLPVILNIQFVEPVRPAKLLFLPTPDVHSWPTLLKVHYSDHTGIVDSEYIRVNPTRSVHDQKYDLDVKSSVTKVSIEIVQTAGLSQETGGYFTIMGYICKAPIGGAGALAPTKAQSCLDTIEGLGITNIGLVECPEDCEKQLGITTALYGAKDEDFKPLISVLRSPLCLAAASLGMLKPKENVFEVSLMKTYKNSQPLEGFEGLTEKEPVYTIAHAATHDIESSFKYTERISFRSFLSEETTLPFNFKVDKGLVISNKTSDTYFGWKRSPQLVYGSNTADLHPGLSFQLNDYESPECLDNPQNCAKNTWSISVPSNGEYQIEMMLGHVNQPTKGVYYYFMQINGEPVISQLALPAGKGYWFTTVVNVTNNEIYLTAECDTNSDAICKQSLTTITNLIISKK